MATGTKQLNVSITPHFSNFIRQRLRSGRYNSASEVVREALRRLEQEELMKEQTLIVDPDNTNESVLQGLRSIERDDAVERKGNTELRKFFDDIAERGKKRHATRRKTTGG